MLGLAVFMACSDDNINLGKLPGAATGDTEGTNGKPLLQLSYSRIKQFDFTWAPVTADYYQLVESTAVGEPFVQVGGDIAGDAVAVSITVPLHARLNASYALRACDSAGCTDSEVVNVTGTLAGAVGYVKPSNTGADDIFGITVAISADGDTLAIGAIGEDGDAAGIDGDQSDSAILDAGAVYVFVREDGVWAQQAYVKASNPGSGDYFGQSIRLSADGNTMAVGAATEDSGATGVNGDQTGDATMDSGAVYVFTRVGPTWSQQAYLKASNPGWGHSFGGSLALSRDGDTLAVGAGGETSRATGIDGDQTDNSALNAGAVYVFMREGGAWAQQAYVKASNTEAGDAFGSVSLSGDGDTMAVGAGGEDSVAAGINGDQVDNSAPGSGAVYVFTRTGEAWAQEAYLKAANSGGGDGFAGTVLSADGNTLAVRAFREDSAAAGVDGDQADESSPDSGAVYVFTREAATWSQQAYLKASNPDVGDNFGVGMAISADGDMLAVGSLGEGSNAAGIGGDQADESMPAAGAAYVFVRSGEAWSQRSYVKAPNPGRDDAFGILALSADGGTLAIGAPAEASKAAGLAGDPLDNSTAAAGAVYLY